MLPFLALAATAAMPDDLDGDGVPDLSDNCPEVANDDQEDRDADDVGDDCDRCLLVRSPDNVDTDEDGLGDDCDNCPDDANFDQSDVDQDLLGDVCDPFPDGEGDDLLQDMACGCSTDAGPGSLALLLGLVITRRRRAAL